VSLDSMRDEHDRLSKKLDQHWNERLVLLVDAKTVTISECPVCKATVIDTYEHRNWHLRCLQ
jgi:hypothetical protein